MNRIIAGAAFIALGAFLLWWFSTPQLVKRRIHGLFDTISFETTLGTGSRAMRAGGLEKHLDEEVFLHTPDERANGRYRRDDVVGGFQYVLRQARESRFEDVEIESLEIQEDAAEARVSFTAVVAFPRYEPLRGPYTATMELKKRDDGWRISAVRLDP